MVDQFDVIVVGAGPGGYVAAIRASQLGLKVAIVEREHMGGICLNWGCIPTKALLRSAEVFRNMKHAASYGLMANDVAADLAKIVERSRDVSATLSGGIGQLMKKNKVTVFDGEAKLTGKGELTVTDKDGKAEKLNAKDIILATGARARTFPGLEVDGEVVWTYRHALVPNKMPKKLLVVGSGAIGIEFASFYSELGSKVTVVEVMDRILPVEDADISKMARTSFEKQGMTIHTGAKVSSLKAKGDKAKAAIELADGTIENNTYDRAIVAVGIEGNTEGLGLEGMGIKVEGTHVVVNEYCQTAAAGIYAIGDLAEAPWLAHKASHEGVMVAEKIAGKPVHPIDVMNIPGCTYSHPQVASVGLTEEKAKDAGYTVKCGSFPFQANGKAIALGEAEGMIKTVVDIKTGELLGAHMIGAEVTELIQGYTVARTLESTTDELRETIFPHPTLSEMMHEAVLAADGEALHI